jgi:hypothetical protein
VNGLNIEPAELATLGLISNSPGIEVLGLAFPEAEFWEAIARALQKTHAALWTPDHKTKLGIRYKAAQNRILISAKGATNSNWCGLSVPFLALLSNNRKQSEAALRHEATMFDLDEPRLSEVIREITVIPVASERVFKHKAYLETSAAALYAQLHQNIYERKNISINELLPPHVECLRRFLRLELNDNSQDDFARRLIQNLGWDEAVHRLSRIPAHLPDSVINVWKQLSADEQNTLLKKLGSKLVTPIERIHFLELLCHPATTAAERINQIKAQLNWLTDEKTGLAHGRAMLAVVRWVHLRLGWHAEASKWSAFARLCVAWSHGCALHHAFQSANASPDSLEKWFASNSQELFADRFTCADGLAHDAANPTELRMGTWILKGVASACAGLNEDQIRESGVQERLPLVIGKKSFLDNLDIWADRSLGSNLLGSYLADSADDKLKRAVGEAAFDQQFRLQPKPIAEYALDTLLNNPRDLQSMFLLNSMVCDRPIYADLRVKLSKVLAEFDAIQFFKASPDECSQFVLFAGQMAASSTDSTLKEKIWVQCCCLASHLAATDSANGKTRTQHRQLALSFADAVIRLSASQSGLNAGLQNFEKRLAELTGAWPVFAQICGPALVQALNRVPPNESSCLSRLICMVRILS